MSVKLGRGLPAVLEEERQLVLDDGLGAGLVHREPADAGLLEVQRDRPGDVLARGARARGLTRGRRVDDVEGALHVAVPVGHVAQEPGNRGERHAPVAESRGRSG